MRNNSKSVLLRAARLAAVLALAAALGAASACAQPGRTTGTAAATEPPSPSAVERAGERVTMADMVVDGVPLFVGQDAFVAQFGQPLSRDTRECAATGEIQEFCDYAFGEAVFSQSEDGWLWTGVTVNDPAVAGPRGVRAGSALEELWAAFPHEEEIRGEDFVIFYRYNEGRGNPVAVPPSGVAYYSDGELSSVQYDFPLDDEWYGRTSMDDIEAEYVYESHALLRFTIDDGIVTGFEIFTGAYAE